MKSTVIQQMLTDAERTHGERMEDAWRTAIHTPGPRQLKVNRIPLDKPKRFNSFCDSYLTFQHQHHQKKKKTILFWKINPSDTEEEKTPTILLFSEQKASYTFIWNDCIAPWLLNYSFTLSVKHSNSSSTSVRIYNTPLSSVIFYKCFHHYATSLHLLFSSPALDKSLLQVYNF